MSNQLPVEVANLEQCAGQLTALFKEKLPEELSYLAFCSPASFRCPESSNIWHPYFLKKSKIHCLIFPFHLLRAFIGGLYRLTFLKFGKVHYCHSHEESACLVLAPVETLKNYQRENPCKIDTTYLQQSEVKKTHWLIYDESFSDKDYPLSRKQIIKRQFIFLFSFFKTVISFKEKTPGYGNVIIEVGKWILRLHWVHSYFLTKKIDQVLSENKFEKVFCVHELHPHSRILWKLAKEKKIESFTMQHASVGRCKLWYFATESELQAGLVLPHHFGIFSQETERLFHRFSQVETSFKEFCGPRFSHWKSKGQDLQIPSKLKQVLFMTSLPAWENELVLQGMEKLIQDKPSHIEIVLRPHPTARISKKRWLWIQSMEEKGLIKKSHQSLQCDIDNASLIIGAGSTSLLEGNLVGRPTMALRTQKYLIDSLANESVDLDQLTWKFLESYFSHFLTVSTEIILKSKIELGIQNPIYSLV